MTMRCVQSAYTHKSKIHLNRRYRTYTQHPRRVFCMETRKTTKAKKKNNKRINSINLFQYCILL